MQSFNGMLANNIFEQDRITIYQRQTQRQDEIVNELEKDPRIAAAYDLWYQEREEVLRTYKDDLRERVLLSQQKEFKRIKNIVIGEAAKLQEVVQEVEAIRTGDGGSGNDGAGDGGGGDRDADNKQSRHEPTTPTPSSTAKATAPAGQIVKSTTLLLCQIGRMFEDQHPRPAHGMRVEVDSKLKRKIREKKIAMGHKPDDHEEQGYVGPTM